MWEIDRLTKVSNRPTFITIEYIIYIYTVQGSKNFFWTYSSCGASGLNFSLVLTPVELVLKSGILKVLMSSNQHYVAQEGYHRIP